MRYTFLLLASIATIACTFSQAQPVDSVFISFGQQSPGSMCSAADGFYTIPARQFSWSLPGFVFVDPAQLTGRDSVLQITAYKHLKMRAPHYEFRTNQYPYNGDLHAFREYMNAFDRTVYYADDSTQQVLQGAICQDSVSFLWIDQDRTAHRIDESYVKYESFLQRVDPILQQLKPAYAKYRSTQVQPIANELLQPFYVSATEISNRQYRTFVNWVRDSLAFRILYDSLPPQQAIQLLNGTKQQLKTLDPSQKTQNLKRYGFNYDALRRGKDRFYDRQPYYDYLADMYLVQSTRFYKRREFATDRFVYRSAAISPTPIYPDTLSWLATHNGYATPYANMYFWHPAYDNYPVVGLNEAQMQAYCDWLTRRINEAHVNDDYSVKVILPTLYHYEMAVKRCASQSRIPTIDAYPDSAFVIHRTPFDEIAFIQRNYPFAKIPAQVGDESLRKFFEWQQANQTAPIYSLAGGVSEYCNIPEDGDTLMTVLGGNRSIGLVDPHENQLNTVFYRQTVPSGRGFSTVGFRPVICLEPKR